MTSSWFRFRVSDSRQVDPLQLTRPLRTVMGDIYRCYYGPVDDDAHDYLVVVAWETPQAWTRFQTRPAYGKFIGALRDASDNDELDTQVVLFDGGAILFQPMTDVRHVYFPASMSPDARTELLPFSCIYGGWMEGERAFHGEPTVAAVLCFERLPPGHKILVRPGQTEESSPFAQFCQKAQELGSLGRTEFTAHLTSWAELLDDEEEDDEEYDEHEDGNEVKNANTDE